MMVHSPPARPLVLIALALFVLAAGRAEANPQLLVDSRTMEVLYADEAGQPWHPASLTKLMTAFVTFRAIEAGRVSLDTKVILSRNAVSQAPASSGLARDSALTLKDALYVMVVKSANDIAVAVAETVAGTEKKFVDEMNATAKAMGLTATHFVDPNGLHAAGQVTSARDLAMLTLYIRQMFPQYLVLFKTEIVTLGKTRMHTNNNLLTHFAGTTGMKTGYICASGLNIVATVERNGRSLLAVVLGGSSGRERNEMAAQLFLRGLSGALKGNGSKLPALRNDEGADPVNMTPLICGKGAKDYVAERQAAFPLGLKGQPSYLTDEIRGGTYAATNLGRLRDVPLPKRRPDDAPTASVAVVIALPDSSVTLSPGARLDAGLVAPIPMPRLDRSK